MMPKNFKTILKIAGSVLFCLLPMVVLAQSISGLLNTAAAGAGYATGSELAETGVAMVVGTVTRVFISFLGVIFISYLIYGGWMWMSAAGNEEKVSKAQKTIRDGIIGLAVTLAAAGIYLLVKAALITTSATL